VVPRVVPVDESLSLAVVVMSVEKVEPVVVDCSALVEPDSVLLAARVVSVEVADADSVADSLSLIVRLVSVEAPAVEPLSLTIREVSVEVPDKDSVKLESLV
jgi:hypothetical protein